MSHRTRWDEGLSKEELAGPREPAATVVTTEGKDSPRTGWTAICTDPATGTSQFAVPRSGRVACFAEERGEHKT
jgi:hypothetical protein